MVPDIDRIIIAAARIVVAVFDPVFVNKRVTIGYEESTKSSVEGMQNFQSSDSIVSHSKARCGTWKGSRLKINILTISVIIMTNPSTTLPTIVQKQALGTAVLALRVSSPICTTLSKADDIEKNLVPYVSA